MIKQNILRVISCNLLITFIAIVLMATDAFNLEIQLVMCSA